ncbi:MAG: hypothetical protein ACREPM_19180, partial [Gemmatimonadaceae bacterium]
LGTIAVDAATMPSHDATLVALRIPAPLQRPMFAIPAILFAWGLVWTQQSWLYDTLRHRADVQWLSNARNDMTSAAIWVLLTPVILMLAKHAPLRRPRLAARAVAYLGAGLLATMAHIALLQRLTGRVGALYGPEWQMSYLVDLVIFAALATIGHREIFLDWLRAREAASATLTAEVAAAQTRAAKLQSIPPVLLHSLDGIASAVRSDPALTERQLMRLADYLRLALECTDERGVTPERERALDSAVAALRDSGAYSFGVPLTA